MAPSWPTWARPTCGCPSRTRCGTPRPPPRAALDLAGASWQFEAPDGDTFRCLPLAVEAGRRGGLAPAVLNAANEVAVEAFLAGRVGFPDIASVVEAALAGTPDGPGDDLDAVLDADRRARRAAAGVIAGVAA